MPETPFQQRIREQLNLRVGPETAAYLARRLDESADSVPVMAGDARTGRPLLTDLDAAALKAAIAAAQS